MSFSLFNLRKKDFPYSYALIIMAQAGATFVSLGTIPMETREITVAIHITATKPL